MNSTGVVRVITLPNGRQVTLGEYVRSWKTLKTLPPDTLVERWDHFPTEARIILREIRRGLTDRINRDLPVCREECCMDSSYYGTMRQFQHLVNGNYVIHWIPAYGDLRQRFAHRLEA